ncbi:putative 2-oxoglutarate-dependent dioxygenase [Lasiodiplodia theobromae]|uniref:putative 2-oxoglutarate-dependent dioxygenase n=1 Tax=Lasiodiplodia theobromae TaxID=45133 RepID=UPI0015C306BE|nr:putative 2-oxoglutarate-dependent dioxygenase [Lasiodiplodia theobromae]KAF4543224.1 putative 2-oxoglutarate-dependent dioxygenase [Lasiodiplodia theobromae]
MTTNTSAALPIIDISPYLLPNTNKAARTATAHALARACHDTGFFYLTGHGIPDSTLQSILTLARRFFLEASDDEKNAIRRRDAGVVETVSQQQAVVGGDGARGYQRIGENVTKGQRDWHEAVDFYAEWEGEGGSGSSGPPYELLQGPNLWPRHPPGLREEYERYVGLVEGVGTAVVRAMGEALGFEGEEEADVFVRATRKSFWVMRLIGYPGLPEGEGREEGFSCGEHTDYGCVTLLLADSTPNALQVQRKDGSWISADPIPGAFVVNIGDMIERWTNGLWKSTNHRVIHRGANYRVSVPFFFEPDFNARIKPLAKCIAETGGKEKYDEVVYGEHLLAKVKGNFY